MDIRLENSIDVTRSLLDSLNTAFESRKMELISLSSIGLPLSSMLRVIEFLRRSNVFTYAAMSVLTESDLNLMSLHVCYNLQISG